MTPPDTAEKPAAHASFATLSAPPDLWLSLATAPLLLALVGGKVLTGALRELGLLSEESLRGDRLPVLQVPSQPQATPDDRPAA